MYTGVYTPMYKPLKWKGVPRPINAFGRPPMWGTCTPERTPPCTCSRTHKKTEIFWFVIARILSLRRANRLTLCSRKTLRRHLRREDETKSSFCDCLWSWDKAWYHCQKWPLWWAFHGDLLNLSIHVEISNLNFLKLFDFFLYFYILKAII